MGIKDNFSQAVRELWKKDGEQPSAPSAQSKPTELDKYLRQDQESPDFTGEQPVIAETPASDISAAPGFVQNGTSAASAQGAQNTQGFQVPLEVPYFPQDQTPSAFTPAQDSPLNNQNDSRNNAQGEYDPGSSGVNRNVQDIQSNFGQNNANNAPQGAYSQETSGGYNNQGFGRPAGNYGQGYGGQGYGGQGGGGGFVPPVQNVTPMQETNETDEVTVISKNTSIDGNVRSLANMQIDGNIKGNVETTKNVELSGKIIGDITCNNAGMNSAAMQGNISLKGRMRMDRDTILMGDLSSQYADINGRIRGKLDVAGKAELKRDAIVFGDINASTIAVTDGAVIQGYVNTTFLSKDDSRNVFPEAISIDSKE